eukprot:Gb_14510 [translate_table: standard]
MFNTRNIEKSDQNWVFAEAYTWAYNGLLYPAVSGAAMRLHCTWSYIVYMVDRIHPTTEAAIESHHDILAKVMGSTEEAGQAVIHHYTKGFRGFSAKLTPEQASSISKMDGVVSVFESQTRYVHTTHSWNFLGVWPECKSFDDSDTPPIPSKFKGRCDFGDQFNASNCNRKIIGARFYSKGFEAENGPLESFGDNFFRSLRDSDGHGTHTSSTIGGVAVENANLLGLAPGTATGGAPGVRNGILVSASAGNTGLPSTASNVAPWMLTVAASSIDRNFESDVILGNSMTLKGGSINPLCQNGFAGLISGSNAAARGIPAANASFCGNNTLESAKVKGKVVVCIVSDPTDDRTLMSIVVKEAGGVGIIIIDPIAKDVGFQFVLPGTLNRTAYIRTRSTVLNIKPAPHRAVFSSQGPNIVSPDIIKPDVTGPGVNILAAWSPVDLKSTAGRSGEFNIVSGTSMSCPHAAATVAIVKAYHPTWSPAAIKSAIMTTSSILDNTNPPLIGSPTGASTGPFDFGSGHLNALAAIDPGFFDNYNVKDNITFLSSIGAKPNQLRNLTGDDTACQKKSTAPYNLNYPSIGVADLRGKLSVLRTLTNGGKASSVYKAVVEAPPGVKVAVVPKQLKYEKPNQRLSFRVF